MDKRRYRRNGEGMEMIKRARPYLNHFNSTLAHLMEIFLGVIILLFVLWVGNQAWQNPFILNVPMLVFSFAALGGGILFLWLMCKERNSRFDA
jgi:hypothetical protein